MSRTPSPPALWEPLRLEPSEVRFHQALYAIETAATGDSVPVGTGGPASLEIIRFKAVPSLGFPPGDIAGADWDPDTGKLTLSVTFMGLYGPASPLPAHITEAIIQDETDSNLAADVLDLFNHRLIGLLARGWRKYRHHLTFDGGGDDPISRIAFAFFGVNPAHREAYQGIDWLKLLPHAGGLGLYSRSRGAIEAALGDYFDGIDVHIAEFARYRVAIEPEQRWRLGQQATRLGEDVMVGATAIDPSGHFNLHLYARDLGQFLGFLPHGSRHEQLLILMRLLLREPLSYLIVLHLPKEQAPTWRLGCNDQVRLGWSTWLGSKQGQRRIQLSPRRVTSPSTKRGS